MRCFTWRWADTEAHRSCDLSCRKKHSLLDELLRSFQLQQQQLCLELPNLPILSPAAALVLQHQVFNYIWTTIKNHNIYRLCTFIWRRGLRGFFWNLDLVFRPSCMKCVSIFCNKYHTMLVNCQAGDVDRTFCRPITAP